MKVLLIATPPLELSAPPQGPAVLKGAIEAHGHNCEIIDLNILLWKILVNQDKGHYFQSWGMPFINALKDQEEKEELSKLYYELLMFIKDNHYDIVGISVLSYLQWESAEMIVDIVRMFTDAKIVVGGPAIKAYDEDTKPHSLLEKVDDFITGDAERSMIEYINKNKNYPGINNFEPVQYFLKNNYPYADYSDYDFSMYPENWHSPTTDTFSSNQNIYITGSKGCVRKCSFCDVHKIWPSYLFKDPAAIVKEIKHYKDTYNRKMFYFTDSLLNGSNTVLKGMCNEIIDKIGEHSISWTGQWICKNQKSFNEEYYELSSKAGLKVVIVGIESGSEAVRKHMRKNFSNADIEFTLQQCRKYNIKFIPLMMCGYPTETESDFLETLKLLELFYEYKDIVGELRCINMMYLIPKTDVIDRDFQEMIEADFEFKSTDNRWAPEDQQRWNVGENTYDVRIERFYRYQSRAKQLGMSPKFLKKASLLDEYLQCALEPKEAIIDMIKYVHNDNGKLDEKN
jgi:radical SAM superfamily enzyme YgiQ (UPF0313 family)